MAGELSAVLEPCYEYTHQGLHVCEVCVAELKDRVDR